MTDAALARIVPACPLLRVLRVCDLPLTDATPQLLFALLSLETLHADGCVGLSDAGIALLRHNRRLAVLTLAGCTRVGDAAMATVLGACPAMRVCHRFVFLLCFSVLSLRCSVLICSACRS